MSANHFEAKLHALRRAKDGVVVSFVVQPHDVTDAFSRLVATPLGQRYMVAYSAIGDDEMPIEPEPEPDLGPKNDAVSAKPLTKERRKFDELPLPQQVALKCQDADFQNFISSTYMSDDAAVIVRDICGVQSRSEIVPHTDAAMAWRELMADFNIWLTDRKYADSIR